MQDEEEVNRSPFHIFKNFIEGIMKKIFLKTALITMAGVCVMAGSAMATPITGGLSMTGSWIPVLADETPTTIPLSTGIDFGGWNENAIDNTFVVTTTSGSFIGLGGTIGSINNFQFVSFVPAALWSVGQFSFDMDSLAYNKESVGGNHSLTVTGYGTLSAAGFDDTPGSWILTSQGADGDNFAWSASADTDMYSGPQIQDSSLSCAQT